MGALRQHRLGLGEDRHEHIEERRQEIDTGARPYGRVGGTGSAAPAHLVVAAPEGHGEGAEVPEDGAQGASHCVSRTTS